jgi:uncharacterized membrane protein YphA (DoxX/SURF4 family)
MFPAATLAGVLACPWGLTMAETGFAGIAAVILEIMRVFIAVVFLRAGMVKLTGRKDFRLAVTNYEILPAGLAAAAAVIVPVTEATAGLLLLLGVLPGVVAAILAALLVCFSAAITVNLARGRIFDCGCGSSRVAPQTISWRHVAVNAILAASAAAISVAPPGGLELLPGPRGVFSVDIPGGSGLPVLLAAALVLVTARMLAAAAATRRQLRAPGS